MVPSVSRVLSFLLPKPQASAIVLVHERCCRHGIRNSNKNHNSNNNSSLLQQKRWYLPATTTTTTTTTTTAAAVSSFVVPTNLLTTTTTTKIHGPTTKLPTSTAASSTVLYNKRPHHHSIGLSRHLTSKADTTDTTTNTTEDKNDDEDTEDPKKNKKKKDNNAGDTTTTTTTEASENPLDRIRALTQEAGQHYAHERYAESVESFREKIRLQNIHVGPSHPDSLESIEIMCMILSTHLDKGEEAVALLRPCYQTRLEQDGKYHERTIGCLSSLASALMATKNDDSNKYESEALLRKILKHKRRSLGDMHPETLASVVNWGCGLLATGKLQQGEALLRLTSDRIRLQIQTRTEQKATKKELNDLRHVLATTLENLAGLLKETGREAEAAPLLDEMQQLIALQDI